MKVCWDESVRQVEEKLAARLEAGLVSWSEGLTKKTLDRAEDGPDINMDTYAPVTVVNKAGGEPNFKVGHGSSFIVRRASIK